MYRVSEQTESYIAIIKTPRIPTSSVVIMYGQNMHIQSWSKDKYRANANVSSSNSLRGFELRSFLPFLWVRERDV